MEKKRLLIFAIFIVLSIIFITIGFISYFSSKYLIKNSIETNGTIVNGHLTFTNLDGKEIEKTSFLTLMQNGKNVQVYYIKDNPTIVKIKSFSSLWLIPSLLFIMSFLFIILSIPIITGRKNG